MRLQDGLGLGGGWDRQDAAEALYEYYIKGANASYTSGTVNSKPVELEKDNAKMQKIEENYVAGPYKINKLLDVDYTISATYTDMDNKAITPTLGVKDENGNIVATNKTLKELEGTEFYLIMPVSSNITGIKMNITTSYKSRTLTYWSVENAPNTEQPVVIVEETPYSFADEASLIVPKPFDLSLRKFITAVNGIKLENENSRIPQVDVTALKNNTNTTATYNHPKTPVRVTVGDIVEYTIRVYNEGEIDGYVEEITDHLPAQLEYIVDDEVNIENGWEFVSSSDLKTVKTSYLSKANETSTGSNKLAAFNGEELAYKDVKIRCKVVSTNPMASKITNIADVDFVKEKFTELSVFFIDIIDKLTSITNARLNEIEESQREIDNKISKVQSVVNNIENDIYADDENCEFEIICPYCNYQFVTDIDSEINEEVECPECHNVIELDWNEGECSHECSDCKSNCVREDGEEYNQDKKDNEEDNM